MTTEYRVRLDRRACDGVFACLVRDDRFAEATDGLATIDGGDRGGDDGDADGDDADEMVVAFADDRLADAEQAARACPVGAIDVTEVDDE
ncbi:ferredoxin [Halopelagius longus]|uniref:Ferredoxin n=1 Tax=Halopelagius longus TaxID=1236180 RepID=A0A1H0ZF50_9EURY|nr:ferredoxin [Halopelagius longus]RDI70260.1 ferredoxin [Halopelagius longus]SDQ26047.1 Ferredoxin [Halopelagius longus]